MKEAVCARQQYDDKKDQIEALTIRLFETHPRKKAEMMLDCAQALTWERRWRAKWVPSPADHSAFSVVYLQEWIRTLEDHPSSLAPQVFSIHHNEGYDPTPCPATTLVDTAFNLWNDFTDDQIFLANTADPQALRRSLPMAPEACDRNVSYSDSTWDQHEKWNDNGVWSSDARAGLHTALLATTDERGCFTEARSLPPTTLAGRVLTRLAPAKPPATAGRTNRPPPGLRG